MSNNTTTGATRSTTKRQKKNPNSHQNRQNIDHQSLLPGLPDHIAELCLSRVHTSILYSVCHSWRSLTYSPSFPPHLSIYALLSSTQITSDQTHLSNSITFSSFDPISSRWLSISPPPPLRLLLSHPSFISRNLPIQSVNVSGKLVLLAATADQFVPALSRPLVFNPLSRNWTYGPPLATPRRWCAAGASRNVAYVASGIGSHYSSEVARSLERWELDNNDNNNNNKGSSKRKRSIENKWEWEKMERLRDGKFSREAIDAIGWRGKLCMVNVKGNAAKEGIIYDVKHDVWEDMPEGMLLGWTGPAAAMDEETIYVGDESKGVLKRYDPDMDMWVEVAENELVKGAQCIAAGGGKVCVVCGDGVSILVVDVVVSPPRWWVVDIPDGYQALAIHILPRMSQPDFHT